MCINMIDFTSDDVKIKRIIKIFVSSTIDIIRKKGIDHLTVRKVAEISGYNAATIYNYFDNSRQLIFFASINFMKDYFQETEKIIDNNEDPLNNYIQLWKIFCTHSYQHPKIYYPIFGENIDENPQILIEKYFSLYPENFGYSPAQYLPVIIDLFSKNNITKPIKKFVNNNYFSFNEAKKIDEVNTLFYQGMLSLLVNNRISYSPKEATNKTIDHIIQTINNANQDLSYSIEKIDI